MSSNGPSTDHPEKKRKTEVTPDCIVVRAYIKLAIYKLYLTWFCNVHVCWSLSFKIPDNYEGYSLEHFCVPGHYIADLRHVMIPKGLIMDRSVHAT